MKPIEQAYNNWLGGRRYNKLLNITREEWCQWWMDTGMFDMRGTLVGNVFMKRIDQSLPFQLDNIKLMLKMGNRRPMKEIQFKHSSGWDSKGWDSQ